MTRESYRTRSGDTLYRPVLPEDASMSDLEGGFCLACGTETDSEVEPDARQYWCNMCGQHKVYGLQELLLMGLIRFGKEN